MPILCLKFIEILFICVNISATFPNYPKIDPLGAMNCLVNFHSLTYSSVCWSIMFIFLVLQNSFNCVRVFQTSSVSATVCQIEQWSWCWSSWSCGWNWYCATEIITLSWIVFHCGGLAAGAMTFHRNARQRPCETGRRRRRGRDWDRHLCVAAFPVVSGSVFFSSSPAGAALTLSNRGRKEKRRTMSDFFTFHFFWEILFFERRFVCVCVWAVLAPQPPLWQPSRWREPHLGESGQILRPQHLSRAEPLPPHNLRRAERVERVAFCVTAPARPIFFSSRRTRARDAFFLLAPPLPMFLFFFFVVFFLAAIRLLVGARLNRSDPFSHHAIAGDCRNSAGGRQPPRYVMPIRRRRRATWHQRWKIEKRRSTSERERQEEEEEEEEEASRAAK